MSQASEYRNLYQQEWVTTPAEHRMYHLAMEYEQRCEAFDQTVCSLRDASGVAMPANYREGPVISRNSNLVASEIAERENISLKELMEAVKQYRRRNQGSGQ